MVFIRRGLSSSLRKKRGRAIDPRRFAQQVARYPERIAVKTESNTLTHDALNRIANGVAHAVLAEGRKKEEQIALLFRNDALMIAAILGVLKSGKTCVPLNPASPYARIRSILEDSNGSLIVTNNTHLS
jgi:non-ribosomal peptide synthetase component F